MAANWQPQQQPQEPTWISDWSTPQSFNNNMAVPSKEAFWGFSRRKASRITKPSSAGTSPHSIIRRKTVNSQSPTHYQRLLNHRSSQYPVDTTLLAASLHQQDRSRPVSWHPSSGHMGSSQSASFQNTWEHAAPNKQQSTEMFGTAAIYGLVTPVPYPIPGDSISNEYFAPLDNNNYGPLMMPQQAPYTPSETTGAMQIDTTGWNCDVIAPQLMTDLPDQYWMPTDSLSMHSSIPYDDVSMNFVPQNSTDITAPPTPDGLPIQQFDETTEDVPELLAKPSGDDLVGMGLYDAPEEVAFSGGLLGGMDSSLLTSGKGLKLEETFSPAPEEEDGEAEAEGEDDDEVVEGASDGKQPEEVQHTEHSDSQYMRSSTLDGQSFYFEEDDYDYE